MTTGSYIAFHGKPQLPAKFWPGVGIAVILGLIAALGPVFIGDENAQNLSLAFQAPSRSYWLGTDHLGRSVLARVIKGAATSLGLAVVAVAATALAGTVLGALSAWCRGWTNTLIMGLANTLLACPTILFVLLVAGLFGNGTWSVLIGICIAKWPAFARLSYIVTRSELIADHVEASRLLGFRTPYILAKHILPGVAPQITSTAALSLASTILTISAVGFLGIGIAPPTAEWGAMVADAIGYFPDAPYAVFGPACAIFLATLSATLIGESLASPTSTSGRS
ncbi:ABC transporter permease [Chelatococcus asaccharovorans]|uniref:Peptide/nickel transport system permease protein n=1 Tax=Chelatococcus asaccharovorans TaxID=28210 RepID=A0A2V3U6J3_9HYPH|nr:ABC transporter permease [Chelatococcus asaccharovorans]MBS7705698.1 ABC transporter permease [Chelatococcus asaccharovorans]PXW58717.1 peptide/nickel transport system permease protein [Chelatococcus asaccharovorans]